MIFSINYLRLFWRIWRESRPTLAFIQNQGISDLDRIYRIAQQDGADFNLAYIGSDFHVSRLHKFDGEYMKRLFEYAFELSAKGYPWHKSPST